MNKIEQVVDLLEKHPTTRTLARDTLGLRVSPSSPKAICWCALGAIAKVYELPDGSTYSSLADHPLVNTLAKVYELPDGSTYSSLADHPLVNTLARKIARQDQHCWMSDAIVMCAWDSGYRQAEVIQALKELNHEALAAPN